MSAKILDHLPNKFSGLLAALLLSFFMIALPFSPIYASNDIVEAAKNGDLAEVKRFIDQNADVNMMGLSGYHALDWAAGNGYAEIAKILLGAKADPNLRKSGDWTPIIRAAQNQHIELVDILIKAGANINAQQSDGQTALYGAVKNGNLDIVKLLLSHNANLDIATIEGQTPLMVAGRAQNYDVVKLLLAKKADVNLRDYLFHNTALIFAVIYNDQTLMKMLIAAKADLEVKANNDLTAFMIACETSNLDAMAILHKSGANINARDSEGKTALYHAKVTKNNAVINWLVKAKAIE